MLTTFATTNNFLRKIRKKFDFANLPYVVQKRVIKCMTSRDIFLLSQTSKKIARLLRFLKATEADFVVYTLAEKNLLSIDFRLKNQKTSNWRVKFADSSMEALKLRIREYFRLDYDFRVWGQDMVFKSFKSRTSQLTFQCLHKNWPKSITYFNETFSGPCFQLKIDGKILDKAMKQPDFKFPVDHTQYLTISGECVQWSALSQLIRYMDVKYVLKIDTLVDGYCEGFKKVPTHTIILKNAPWLRLHHLKTIDCSFFYAYQGTVTVQDVFEFVKHWKRSKSRKLKFVDIKLKGYSNSFALSEEQIKLLDAKTWDPMVRDRDFSCNNKRLKSGKRLIECSDGYDVRRKDGLMATVVLTRRRFQFVVWLRRFVK